MSSRFSFGFFLFLSFFYSQFSFGMLNSGYVVVSPDGGHYVTLLGHFHEEKGDYYEERQLDEIVALCKEGAAEGKKYHFLYEFAGDVIKILASKKEQRKILTHLEDAFAEAEIPNCVVENVEIRDCGISASQIFEDKGNVRPLMQRNDTSILFGNIRFQDIFDEFQMHADRLALFVQKIIQVDPACRRRAFVECRYMQACDYIDDLRKYIEENNIKLADYILPYAQGKQADCDWLEVKIRYAFSYLFNLHIFQKVLELYQEKQVAVVAGGHHASEVEFFLTAIGWKTRMYKPSSYPLGQLQDHLKCDLLRSFLLNETEWDKKVKTILKYLSSITLSLCSQFKVLQANPID